MSQYNNADGRLRGRKLIATRLRLWSDNPYCASCGKLVEYPRGFELDHRTPIFKGGTNDDSNLEILCIDDHKIKSAGEMAAGLTVAYYPEWLQPALGKLTIVFGPPGSGKSTYVQEHAKEGDTVIDLDEIAAKISSLPIYHADIEWLDRAVYARNDILASLSKSNKPAWFITTGKGKRIRDWWIEKLNPTHTLTFNVPADDCIKRVSNDDRRPDIVKARHIKEIRDWWMIELSPQMEARKRSSFDSDGKVQW